MASVPDAFTISHDSHGKSRNRSPDHAIAELARRQHGVVSYAQLTSIELGRGAIEWRLARGRLHRIHAGVYAVGHAVVSREGRWMAAVFAGGDGTVLSHASAAAHLGIRPSDAVTTDVTTPHRLRGRRGLRFHCSRLPADEVTVHERIPVTTPARTLFDLAAVISPGGLARAVNEAEVRRLWDSLSLEDLLRRHPRRPGAAAVRAILATPGATITRSDLEDRFLGLVDRVGLPRPMTNVPLWLGDRWIEADCVWSDQRLIVELDGYATHRTRAAYENDRARDRALTAAGWRVTRVTWRQLRDEPEAVVGDLRALLTPPAGPWRR